MKKQTRLIFVLKKEMHQMIRRCAQIRQTSMADVVRQAIEYYFKKEKK